MHDIKKTRKYIPPSINKNIQNHSIMHGIKRRGNDTFHKWTDCVFVYFKVSCHIIKKQFIVYVNFA